MGPVIENVLVGLVVILFVAAAIRAFIVMTVGARDTLENQETPKMDYRYEDFLKGRNEVVNSEPLSVDLSGTLNVPTESEIETAAAKMNEDRGEYPTYQLKAELLPIRKRKKKVSKKKKPSKKKTKTRGKK